MTVELVSLCTMTASLADAITVGEGPAGFRMVGEALEMTFTGERLNAKVKGHASADWLTIVGVVGTVDARMTLETDDGAIIYVHYRGRTDFSRPGAPVFVAPLFETGDSRYAWLNTVQAVGKGVIDGNRVVYEWFEVR